MALYEGGLLKVVRKLDGKGRLQLPGDFREAVGFALDEEDANSVKKEDTVIPFQEGRKLKSAACKIK